LGPAVRQLHSVHALICGPEQAVRIVAIERVEADAEARCDRQLPGAGLQRNGDRGGDGLRQALGLGAIGDPGENDDELVSADSRYRVGSSHHGGNLSRDVLEDLIPGRVAERVVDLLEGIQIEVYERVGAPAGEKTRESLVE